MARAITIQFLGDAKQFQRTVGQVEGSTSSLGSKLKKVGTVAAAGFAVAGAAAVKFGVDAIGNASDLNETLSKSEAIFGRQAPAMERWAGAAARSAGLSKNAALEAAAGFGDMFSQIGFAGDQAAKMSKDVVQMSADLGSFNNLDTADVADRMSAAFRGEYDSLQKVIPNINAARVESEALAATGKKTAAELTAQEKAAAVLAIVHKDGARAMGDFERTSGGLANQQKILRAQLENVSSQIGQKLLPFAVKLATWANDTMIPALSRLGGWFSRTGEKTAGMQVAFAKIIGWIRANWQPAFKQVAAVVRDAVSIAQSLWKRFGKILTSYAQSSLKNVISILKGAFQIVRGIFKTVSALLRGDWKGAWDGIKSIVRGAFGVITGVVKQLMNIVRTVFKVGWSAVRGIVGGAWDGIKSLVRNGADAVVGAVKGIGGKVASAARGMFDGLVTSFKSAINSIIRGWNGLSFSIPGFDPPGPGKVPGVTISTPNLPYLASGGIVPATPGGRMVVTSEGGYDEAVIPLDGPKAPKWIKNGPGGGNVIVNINGALDPVAVGKQVEQVLAKYVRTAGRPLQVRTIG